jgi:hypothetical protein
MKAMLARVRSRLTFANVMSLTALFFALGGGAYAMTIPKNSVGALQLKSSAVTGPKVKKDAVTAAKVKDGSLLAQDFKAGQLPAGPQGPKGDPGGSGGAPSGPAGGSLRGAYPNPALAPGSVGNAQIIGGAVDGAKVLDGSLTGIDIDVSTLGQVPSALLGGLGRQSPKTSCDPDPTTRIYVTCTSVTVNLPAPARALVIGGITANIGLGKDASAGNCALVTVPGGTVANSLVTPFVNEASQAETAALLGMTAVLPAGPTLFALDCNQAYGSPQFNFKDASLTVVAISPS